MASLIFPLFIELVKEQYSGMNDIEARVSENNVK